MSSEKLKKEINRRRTFAIISHPDAGKTTLTEKLLLYGGAIHLAGSVKARRAKMHATSDWMELEKERGISVTSSVLQFEYEGLAINLLDTPGHKDFSEDTYRTIMAADSVVMLIDHAKGVEPQTRKLFEVCRMRGLPIFTFMNKLDRFGKNSFELLDELENVLGIHCAPLFWPVGQGKEFKGIYDRQNKKIVLFSDTERGQKEGQAQMIALEDPSLSQFVEESELAKLKEDLELLDGAGTPFDLEQFRQGKQTPVFWGSAMTNFGVQNFLDQFIQLAPTPTGRTAGGKEIAPQEDFFSGFVFKIQANMDPKHRDRLAFIRVCSGEFKAGEKAKITRNQKEIKLKQPQQMMANERQIKEKAYPGDIVGIYDSGNFHIGDTLSSGPRFEYEGIPHFAPEIFCKIRLQNPLKRKQMQEGLRQISEEGGVQLYWQLIGSHEDLILGAVGQLQLDVLKYRLNNEYGADMELDTIPYQAARWVSGPSDKIEALFEQGGLLRLKDRHDNPVALFESQWAAQWAQDKNTEVKFSTTMREHEIQKA